MTQAILNFLYLSFFFASESVSFANPTCADLLRLIEEPVTVESVVKELTTENRIQESIWVIRGYSENPRNADALEKAFTQRLLEEKAVRVKRNSIGYTESYVVTLESGIKGIFKPQHEDWKSGRDYAKKFSNYKAEVDMFKFDKILETNLVPITIEREIDGMYGSFQAFVVKDATVPREDQYQKLRLLDYLVNNLDRKSENYFFSYGKIVAIDHGLAFQSEWSTTRVASAPRPRLDSMTIRPEFKDFQRNLQFLLTEEKIREILNGRYPDKVIEQVLKRRQKLLDLFDREIGPMTEAGDRISQTKNTWAEKLRDLFHFREVSRSYVAENLQENEVLGKLIEPKWRKLRWVQEVIGLATSDLKGSEKLDATKIKGSIHDSVQRILSPSPARSRFDLDEIVGCMMRKPAIP